MYRSNFGFGGYYPRGYLGAGIGYPYMPLFIPYYGYGCYPGYGYGCGYPYGYV